MQLALALAACRAVGTARIPDGAAPPRGSPPDPTSDSTAPPGPTETGPTTTPDPDVATWLPDRDPPSGITHVIFFGDSITHGYGVPEEDWYRSLLIHDHPADWPTPHEGDLTERFGDLEVLDLSKPGETTNFLVHVELRRAEQAWTFPVEGGTLAIGTIGSGDVLYGLGSDLAERLYEQNLATFADWLADPARFPDGAWLFLANVYDVTDGQAQREDCWDGVRMSWLFDGYARANAASLLIAQEHGFAWVDDHGHFLGHGARVDDPTFDQHDPADPTDWYYDCYHPDERGHHELRRLFLSAIDGVPLQLAP